MLNKVIAIQKNVYDLINEWNMHIAQELLLCLGDINGYVGRHNNTLEGIHHSSGIEILKEECCWSLAWRIYSVRC